MFRKFKVKSSVERTLRKALGKTVFVTKKGNSTESGNRRKNTLVVVVSDHSTRGSGKEQEGPVSRLGVKGRRYLPVGALTQDLLSYTRLHYIHSGVRQSIL